MPGQLAALCTITRRGSCNIKQNNVEGLAWYRLAGVCTRMVPRQPKVGLTAWPSTRAQGGRSPADGAEAESTGHNETISCAWSPELDTRISATANRGQ